MTLLNWIPAFVVAFSMTFPVQFAEAKSSGSTGKKAAAEYMKAGGKAKKKTANVVKKSKKTVSVGKKSKKSVSASQKSKSKKQAVVQKKSNKKLAAQQVKQKRDVASAHSKHKTKSKVKKNKKRSS